MAATASPQMPMTSNPDFGPDMGRRRSSIVHMGAYRVIRRNSQMLSESGPLLSPGNPSGPPASPLLQIASDINNSLLAVRRSSLPRRYSTELQDTPLTDKSIRSGSSSPSRGVSPDMTRHRTETLSHSKSFSYPSTGSASDLKSQLQNQDNSGGRLAYTVTSPFPVHAFNVTAAKPQSFWYPNLRAKMDKRGSYSEASTTKPDEDLQFHRGDSKSEPRTEDGHHGNTRRGSHLLTLSARSPTASQLERKRLSVEFTALREHGRQLLTDYKSPSSPQDTLLPTHDRLPSVHIPKTDSEESEDAKVNETSDSSVISEPKAKSKFLSSLYNGHEKIQHFINKGRSQIKAQELNARLNINRQTGSLFDGSDVNSSPLIQDYRGDGGVIEKRDAEHEGNSTLSESSHKTSDLNSGSLIITETATKTVDIGRTYRDLDLTPVRGGTGAGGSQLSTDRFASKSLRASDVISPTHHSANNRSLRNDESWAGHSRFSNDLESPVRVSTASPDARFSSSFDDNNEVFLSPGVAPGALRTTKGAAWTNRRFTSFDVFDFSTSHKRSPSISPGSSVSSSRSSTPVPGASAPKPRLGSDQERRRFSLPDTDMEAREKIKTALKTASSIKDKYTTGSFSASGRRSNLKGQSPTDQRLDSEKPQRPVPKPRMSLSSADARKSRDISLRSNLVSASKERNSKPVTSPPKPAKRTSSVLKSEPPKHEQSYSTDLARQSARELQGAADTSKMEATPMPTNAVEYLKSTVRRASSDVKDYLLSSGRSSPSEVTSSLQSRSTPSKAKAATSGDGMADRTKLINIADVRDRENTGESRQHQQRRETERGSGLTDAASLGRRASYSPVIGGHSDSGASTRAPVGRSGSFSVRDAATVSLSYKGITNLTELQKLLSKTSDSVERNNIRKVIRHLRHLPDYEQLKKSKAGSSHQTAKDLKTGKSSAVERPDVVLSAALAQPTPLTGQGDVVPRRSSNASDVIISSNKQTNDKGFVKRPAHSIDPNTDCGDLASKSAPDVTLTSHGIDTSSKTHPKANQTLINNHNISPDKQGLAKVEPKLIADSLYSKYVSTTKDVKATRDVDVTKDKLTTNAPITEDESANVLDFVRSRLYSRSSNADRKTPDNLTSPAKEKSQLSVTDAKTPRRGSTGGERYRQERQQILAGLAPRLSLTPETSTPLIKSPITPKLPSSFEARENLGDTRGAHGSNFPTAPSDSVKTTQHSISADIIKQGNQHFVGKAEPLHPYEDGNATDSQRGDQHHQDFTFPDLNSSLDKPKTPVTKYKIDDYSSDREKRFDAVADLKATEKIKKSPEVLLSSRASGTADPGYAGSTVRRTQSLNAPTARDPPGGMLKPSSGRMSQDYTMKHETSKMGAQDVTDHGSDSTTHSSVEFTSGVSRPPERMYDTLNSDHSTWKMTSASQGVSKTFPSSRSSDTDATAETLELPTKPTLTRSRPVGRSLTESRLTRPDRYRGQTDAPSLAIIDEQSELGREEPPKDGSDKVDPQLEESVRGSRQRKVGVIMSGAPVVKLETEFNSMPIQNDYGLRPATSDNTFEHLNDLLRDFDSRKPVDEEALAARMKRFSAPVRTYTHPQVVAVVDDSTGGSQPKRRHSEIYNKQEAVKMEQAFNSLLEDLDKVSTSEGNVSDIDLSDGEDLLALSSSSSASNDSNRHVGLTPCSDHGELIPVESQVKESSVSPPHMDTTDSSDFEQIQTTVDAELFSLDNFLDNELDAGSEVIHTAATFRDNFSKEDNGIDPSVDDVSHLVGKDDVDSRRPLSSPPSSAPTPIVTTPSKPKGSHLPVSDGISMTGERVGGDLDTDHVTDTDSPDVVRDAKILTSTTTLQLAPSPQISAPQQVGARTFHVNTANDGSVTLQASAKDENQNRIVTVRTKMQRTPSNADEELRDKIVQRRVVTPGGTVVEEKGVVQTKKRLTSRGSNYYTRKTYTTRTKRDKEGVETVEHDVTVETENKSVSQGQSWGDKVVTQVTLEDGTIVNGTPTLTSALAELRGTENADVLESLSEATDNVTKDAASVAKELGLTEAESKQTKITVQKPKDPPEILYALRDVTSVEGKHVVLECSIKASPPSRVTWYKDDVELTHADLYAGHYDEASGRATLTIPDATIFDTADYSCLCHNEDGEARTRANVVIKRRYDTPPTFTHGLSDVTVTEGHSVVLTCGVVGAASASWTKDGSEVKESPEVKQRFDGGEASLEIFDVFLDDAGLYECVVHNDCGDSSSSCTLNVLASSSDATVVPMFLTKLPSTHVFNGETLSLECDVIGSPEPNIFWLKDGKDLSTDLSFSANYDGRVSSLQISNMRPEDAGHYKCVAENSAGKVSVEAHVTVQVKRAPHFVSKLQDATVTPGKGVVLRCEIMGSPQPSVAWVKDGTPVGRSSQKYIQSYNNGVARLEVLKAEVEDGGRYECTIKNIVGEISCGCVVRVEEVQAPKAIETFAPKTEQVVEQAPKVTRSRPYKKLSEPKPSDIITAVLQRATVQRTQSFGPSSTSMVDVRQNTAHPHTGNTSSSSLSGISGLSQIDLIMSPVSQRPETLVYQSASTSDLTATGTSPKLDHSSLDHSKSERSFVSTSELSKEQESSLFTPSARVTNLGRSVSMHVVRNNLSSPDGAGVKPTWATHGRDSRETISKAGSLEVITESKPLGPIPGYKSVSPVFLTSPEKEKLSAASPLTRSDSNISHSHSSSGTALTGDASSTAISVDQKQAAVKTLSASLSSLTAQPTSRHDSPLTKLTTPPCSVTPPTSSFAPPTLLVSPPTSSSAPPSSSSVQSEEGSSETPSQTVKAQLPRVSLLRQQFLQNDLLASSDKHKQAGVGVKRWHSLPPQDTRPNVVKRDKTVLPPPSVTAMPSYDEINDEEELHKLMNSTEDFEERKKIRARLRELRDKQREDYEAKRKQREAEVEDLVKKKFEKAEEEKKKKMDAYKHQAPTHERESKYQQISQNLIADKHKVSEDEKAKKLASYTHIAETTGPGGDKTVTKTTSSSSSEQTPGGGTRTTTTTTKVESSTKSFGGTSYGKPAEVTAQELTQRLMSASGPGVSGRITVKTESWNSSDGKVEKSEKSQSWGAKPQGPQNAMAAFKQMDNATTPAGAKPKVSLARSPSAIKQVLLDWTKAMTRGYPGVEITNFSSSWNNGLAFCALIHHFFPDAFDFSTLDATKRRYNFTLAFDTAEKEADIAPLLDVDDMVKMKNPDWKCVFTYVQSIYRHLKDHANNKASSVEQ